MKVSVHGCEIEFDENLEYADFFIDTKNNYTPTMTTLNITEFVKVIADSPIDVLIDLLVYLERWNEDVPRKKFLRNMKRSGTQILSREYLFEGDKNDTELQKLENTGLLAKKFLEALAPDKVGSYWKTHQCRPF